MKTKKLSLWEKLSYGGGDVANCITFGVTSAYLSYYYTDIVGIPLAAVGMILGTARILEAGANLCTGIAIDRTISKLGRTKPYLYTTTLPLMVLFSLLFIVPDVSQNWKTVFAFVTYLVFCLLYAVNNTAYGTLLSMMTRDSNERKTLGNYKLFGCGVGNMIASFCTLPLVTLIGNGGHYQFAATSLIYAIISFLFLGNCAISCKERTNETQDKMSVRESLQCAVTSRSWILLCIISCLAFLINGLRNTSCIYYAKYCLGMDSLASILLTMSTISMIVTSPFIAKILTKLGNKNCMILGFSIYIVFTFFMFMAGDHLILLILFAFLSGIGSNLASGPAYTICSDTMDEVEELTGKRPQGIMTSVMMCTMKLGVAVSGIIFSAIMNAGGYAADALQTKTAIIAIHWNLFWLPICLAIICLILALFFDTIRK